MQDRYRRIDEILLRRTAGPYIWVKIADNPVVLAKSCGALNGHQALPGIEAP
jgi:hypothetical protein